MRIYELAKKLKLDNKALMEKLRAMGIKVKSHMSSVDKETAQIIGLEIKETQSETGPKKKEVKKEKKPELELALPITVKDLSVKLQQKPSLVIKKILEKLKLPVHINQSLDEATSSKVVELFGFSLKKAPSGEELLLKIHEEEKPEDLSSRPPVVTFMGHVDHGKTSLLDSIRKTQVTEKEFGGITQHVGAYRVSLPKGNITFLDTPGHEAFTAMRARGANITDIVVLVVAADDGVMPQTLEAIDHARAANVPIIIAINKIDKPQADVQKVKNQLAKLDLKSEDWGGKTITVEVSAKEGTGIEQLLEMILLQSEMMELKANYKRLASGVIIEAQLTKGKGSVITILVQNGKLSEQDIIICGPYYGKIKAMFDDLGRRIKEATPSLPVEILGLSGLPEAGEKFYVVEDEKKAKEICLERRQQLRQKQLIMPQRISLEGLYSQIKEGKVKELSIILKADVQGSLGAIEDSLEKLDHPDVKFKIIHSGIGSINNSDVILAAASDAIIIGFHVKLEPQAKELAEKEGVDIRTYRVIYEVTNDLKAALEGLLEPKIKKSFLARVLVKRIFKLSKAGIVAGCFLQKGRLPRSANISVIRNGEIMFEGKISSLKRFKNDVREVTEGQECGITIEGFSDVKEGDIIEAYEIQKIARKL